MSDIFEGWGPRLPHPCSHVGSPAVVVLGYLCMGLPTDQILYRLWQFLGTSPMWCAAAAVNNCI